MKDINLLLEEDKVQQAGEKNENAVGKAKMIAMLVAAIMVVALTIALPLIYSRTLDARLSSLQGELELDKYMEIKKLNAQIAENERILKRKQQVMDAIDREHHSAGDIIDIMKNTVPEGCAVKDLDFNTNTVRVTIEAGNAMQVAEFLLNTGRLEFITLADSWNSIAMGKSKEYSFTFNIAGGEGR